MHNTIRDFLNKQYNGNVIKNAILKSNFAPCICCLDPLGKSNSLGAVELNKHMSDLDTCINTFMLFDNTLVSSVPYKNTATHVNSIYCIDGPVIFQDKHYSEDIDSPQKLRDLSKIASIKDIIAKLQTEYRYINYSINTYSSNASNILDTLNMFVKNLNNSFYNTRICISMKSPYKHALLDILSISFYRLPDVIPIFIPNKVDGVVMEIMLLNSITPWEDAINRNYFSSTKIVFSKYTDNVLVVDGEQLYKGRNNNIASNATTEYVEEVLCRYTPNDTQINNINNKKEKSACAE